MEIDRLSFAWEREDDVSLSFPYWNQFMVETVEEERAYNCERKRKRKREKERVNE